MPVACLHILLIAIKVTGDYQNFGDSCTAKKTHKILKCKRNNKNLTVRKVILTVDVLR